jgi:arsenate reductase
MTERLFRRDAAGRHEARSAGSKPGRAVHPQVLEPLAEIGVDARDHLPCKLDDDAVDWAQVVVATCDDACPSSQASATSAGTCPTRYTNRSNASGRSATRSPDSSTTSSCSSTASSARGRGRSNSAGLATLPFDARATKARPEARRLLARQRGRASRRCLVDEGLLTRGGGHLPARLTRTTQEPGDLVTDLTKCETLRRPIMRGHRNVLAR